MILNKKKIIKWVLLLVWMGFIFFMSHQNGEESSKQSELVLYIFNLLNIDFNSYFGEFAMVIIRKGAHFTEYFILILLAYNLLKEYVVEKRARIYGLILVFLYACSDEFHQSFVPGRGAAFKDVLIDTSGGVFGLLVISMYHKLKVRFK